MFAVYRTNFNTIDRMNKQALGVHSLTTAIGTRTWWKRVAMSLISLSSQNAYQAFVRPWSISNNQQRITRSEFMERLATELINNPEFYAENIGPSSGPGPSG